MIEILVALFQLLQSLLQAITLLGHLTKMTLMVLNFLLVPIVNDRNFTFKFRLQSLIISNKQLQFYLYFFQFKAQPSVFLAQLRYLSPGNLRIWGISSQMRQSISLLLLQNTLSSLTHKTFTIQHTRYSLKSTGFQLTGYKIIGCLGQIV